MSEYHDRNGDAITADQWAALFRDQAYKRVASDELGDIFVSTVWLGLNHNFDPDGEPLIFETMIFGGTHDEDQWRYSTEAEALEGHAAAVLLASGGAA